MSSFEAYLNNKIESAKEPIIESLIDVGEALLEEAVISGDYNDITGNLRSSLYCILSDNGDVIFEKGASRIFDGSIGQAKGKALAHSLARRQKGLVLTIVAGMEYAAIVETRKNVLSSAQIMSEQLIEDTLKELGLK